MPKRRLPIVQTSARPPSPSTDSEARWIAIGAALAIVLWLPLLAVALWGSSTLLGPSAANPTPREVALALAPLPSSYAAACTVAGLLTRYAHPGYRPSSGGISGLVAGSFATALALLGGTLAPWSLALTSWGAMAGAGALFMTVGVRLGRRVHSS